MFSTAAYKLKPIFARYNSKRYINNKSHFIFIIIFMMLNNVTVFSILTYASVNSTCAQPQTPPPPSPVLLRGICPPCQSQGWGICKFCTARGPGTCQSRGYSRAFDTQAVSYQNTTTQKVLLENSRLVHLSRNYNLNA